LLILIKYRVTFAHFKTYTSTMSLQIIHDKIFEVRGQRIMLDFDLAALYEVETKALNQAIKRNIYRFPEDFMFKLTINEWETMRSQIVTASTNDSNRSQFVTGSDTKVMRSQIATASQNKRNINATPYAFTEHGVTMLASVLRSEKAIQMNIAIVRAFIAIRQLTSKYKDLAEQIHELRIEMQGKIGEHDIQLSSIYDALENLLDKKEEENTKKQKWIERERIGFKK
jgi:phage regulator Rha-like protein